jgi:hypothetical protein
MSHSSPHEEPFSEAHLDCPEYRERLMRKLNCLIAVLEVATAKVKKGLAATGDDTERLTRIRNNLESTLDVCLRARAALERRQALPEELAHNLGLVIGDSKELEQLPPERRLPLRIAPLAPGARVEMLSSAEQTRFEALGRIDRAALAKVDLDELARQLQG